MPKIASLTDLPVEIIERIVAKCQENDIEVLIDDCKTIVKRDNPANAADITDADEPGWETEDEEDMEDDEDDEGDNLSVDDLENGMQVAEYCANCEDYHEVGRRHCHVHQDGIVSALMMQIPSLHQLALTCKFLRNLALPYIHQSVDFEALENYKLERYLELIVPKCGQYVKDLWIRVSPNENEEFHEMDDAATHDEDLFEPERRFELAMQILESLPNLTSIDIDITLLLDHRIEDLFEHIKARGSSLTGLHLAADVMQIRLSPTQLSTIIKALPELVQIDITGIDQQTRGEPSFRDALANLTKLECLDLGDAHCVQDDWAKADWQCQLQAIDLDDCQNISGKGVEDLILRHASSLRHLALNATPYQQIGQFNAGDPFDLPKLETLSLDDWQFDFNTLKRFEQCPSLMRLELGTLDDMDPRQLMQLLERNGFAGLKELVLSSEWPTSEENINMEGLELVCFEKGIALEVEPPDSDDEDDDISFEGDDAENEFWDEGFTEDEGEEITDDGDDEDEEDSADEDDADALDV